MFEKNKKVENSDNSSMDVFRPSKGSAKVIIGNGVTLKGDITEADEVQIDGSADVTMKTDNLIVGATGKTKELLKHIMPTYGEKQTVISKYQELLLFKKLGPFLELLNIKICK